LLTISIRNASDSPPTLAIAYCGTIMADEDGSLLDLGR
jgi:hypothetical protein